MARTRTFRSLILLCFLTILPACRSTGGIQVIEPWARAADQGQNSAVYMSITNRGPADTLLAAESAVASEVQLHRSVIDEDGVVSMQQQGSVSIPSGITVSFEPGGLHVMLLDLQRDLVAGETLEVALRFEDHETINVSAEIRNP